MTQLGLPAIGPTCACGHRATDHDRRGMCPWCACTATTTARPAAPVPGPRQTRAAALDAIQGEADTLRKRILTALVKAGAAGLTTEEIEERTRIKGNTVRPRLIELREESRVQRAPAVRLTRAGRNAVVWVAAPSEVRS